MRRTLAAALCAVVALGSPGPAAYAAAAEAVEARVEPLVGNALPEAVQGAALPRSAALSLELPVAAQLSPAILPISAETRLPPAIVAIAAKSAAKPVAAAALAQARTALSVPQAAERAARASPETASAVNGRVFDASARAEAVAQDASALGSFGAGEEPLSPARVSLASSKREPVARRLVLQAKRAAAWAATPRGALTLAAAAVLYAVAPHLGLGLAPLVFGTCNSMRERAIKDATIVPQSETQRVVATKELDSILVNFGKRLKEEAEKDRRVKTAVSAHNAEHGMENPILDLLPAWKEKYARGAGPTNEEAFKELREAVIDRLAATTLKNESREVIEDLVDKTGSWEELLSWEKKHDVLGSLKKAAEAEAAGKAVDNIKERTREDRGGLSGSGTALLGLFLVAGLGLALHAAGLGSMGALGLSLYVAAVVPKKGPDAAPTGGVPLDAYLKSLGLTKEDTDFLKAFTTDIGAREMAPVVGRSKELRRIITILSKPAGTQNNPMILGDKGVGKTAIVEAVAKYLYYDKLPSLKGKRILELDTGRLAAGSGKVGEMEERLTKLRQILAKTNNQVILFVDEIHSILKNVATSSSVPDLLKSPLRNGEMTVIGATTVGEFRKYVEQDPAFADRFDTVQVDEPTQDEAVEMLEGDLEYLEKKFGVEIDPEAAKAAVKLSARYIPEKFLPRKARVLLESSIAEAKPEAARDGVQVQIDQMTDRLRIFVKRYAALKARNEPSKKAEEVQLHNKIVSMYATILALDEKANSFVQEKIDKRHVMATLAKETGIAVGELGEDEYKRLLTMEPWFKERIVGQDEAVKAIADTVRTNKSGLSDPNRPQGVFLFAGKTGVGKTALARTLAEFLFSNPDAVIRLDMSEYMEKFAVQRLFGAPPGYVGYDAGGELTEKVRRQPYSVVLLDEIEKAHPDVLNALLQVFDAGRMTDGRQNTVNFKNTIVIMTSNIGAGSDGEGDEFKSAVVSAIKQRLKPEFVNRVDKIVVFNPLVLEQAKDILDIMLKDVQKRLREQDLELKVSPEAKDFLARKGFDPAYGARPLKRVVESDVTNAISGYLLKQKSEGALVNGGVIEVVMKGEALDFQLKPNPPPTLELAPLPEGPMGQKLKRVIDEALRGPDATKDAQTFESLLFPDRKAVVLEDPLGAFRPNAAPDRAGERGGQSFNRSLGTEAPGLKDAKLEALKDELFSKLAGRLPDGAPAAATAWLDAFAALAKGVSKEGVSLQYRVPAADRAEAAELELLARGDTGFAAQQRLARLFRDHFSATLKTEDEVRARAAQMKDQGLEPDRDLLELKRLIEAVPGATFGYDASQDLGGAWRFWLRLPAAAAPRPDEKAEPRARGGAEEQKDERAAPAPAVSLDDSPISALDARLSPAKMFLFLTQRAPESLKQRRLLAADLLDSKSTQVRLIGLHMAASLLDAASMKDVASASRMLRLSDQKDYVLFSTLASGTPGLPMTAQRDALLDAARTRVDAFRGDALGNRSYGAGNGNEARFYERLAEPVRAQSAADASLRPYEAVERIRSRFARIAWRFAGWGGLGIALGEVALHFMKAPLGVMIAGPLVVGGILFWILMGNFNDVRGYARGDSQVYESLVWPRLSKDERMKVARRRLEDAARGRAGALDQELQARLYGEPLALMSESEKRGLFGVWQKKLEKGYARVKAKNRYDAGVFGTLGLLARLLPLAPERERAALSKLLVEPLRGRWLPSGSDGYLAGLGAWAETAPFTPEELEAFTGLIVNFPANRQATTEAFLPIYRALARRTDLAPDLKAAFDQFLEGVAADGNTGNRGSIFASIELARVRARLGYQRKAWAQAREALKTQLERPDNWGGEPTFLALDRLIGEDPPNAEERAWLLKALRLAEESGQANSRAMAALPLSRLVADDAERLALLLSGVRDATVSTDSDNPLLADLIGELRKTAGAPLKDAALRDAWVAAVRENEARLAAEK